MTPKYETTEGDNGGCPPTPCSSSLFKDAFTITVKPYERDGAWYVYDPVLNREEDFRPPREDQADPYADSFDYVFSRLPSRNREYGLGEYGVPLSGPPLEIQAPWAKVPLPPDL